jgi:polysaccharide pyruvyl transferase CsaB
MAIKNSTTLHSKSSTIQKLILVGNFGAENFGDELILAGFLKKINKELPQTKVVVLSSNPRLVKKFHGVDSLPLLPAGLRSFFYFKWWRSLRKIRQADAVIFPGGGLFTDEESFHAIVIWGIHILAACYFWKPIYLFGQSIGKFKKKYAKNFARFLLRKAELISVRDEASFKELKQLGISTAKIKRGKDTSFYLVKRIPKTKSLKINSKKSLKILVSMRNFPKIKTNFFIEIAKALTEISTKLNAQIFFAKFGKGDLEIWKKICQHSKQARFWQDLELPENAEEVIKEIKKFDLVIGMRLHSLIAAKLAGVPAIGFAYSRKVKAFAKNLIEIKGFKKEKLIKFFDIPNG